MFKLTEDNRKWWILIAMTSCISMIFIDVTVLPITLPTLQRMLNISPIGLQWIINAYTLALTVFVLLAGRCGDRFGHRKIFCWGLFFFSLGSILCGASYFECWFILARVIQGIGGAMMTPTSTAIIFAAFSSSQRGKAIGLHVSIGSIFLALGPFIGGLFSQYLSWRYVFWINIPIALIGFWLTLFSVPKNAGRRRPFDLWGFILTSLGITFIVVALMEAKNWGWTSPATLGLGGLGLSLISLLLAMNRKVEDPYIDLSFFRNGRFVGAVSAIFATQFLLMVTVFWAVFFQILYGYSPAKAGLMSLLSNLPLILVAPIGGHLSDKYGARIPITVGFVLIAFALSWFLLNLENGSLSIILPATIAFGCGIPIIFTPSFTIAMSEVTAEKRGLASGTVTMLRQFSATLGLALMSSLFFTIQSGYFAEELEKNRGTVPVDFQQFQGLLSKTPQALEALEQLPPETQDLVRQAFLRSYVNGFWGINTLALASAIFGFSLSLWLIKQKKESIRLISKT